MGLFGSKKKLNSEEYEKLAKRITDVENSLDKLNSALLSLRGLIHRKATGDFEFKDPEKRSPDRIDDGLDSLRA